MSHGVKRCNRSQLNSGNPEHNTLHSPSPLAIDQELWSNTHGSYFSCHKYSNDIPICYNTLIHPNDNVSGSHKTIYVINISHDNFIKCDRIYVKLRTLHVHTLSAFTL